TSSILFDSFICAVTPPSPIYPLSLHDALPISVGVLEDDLDVLPARAQRRLADVRDVLPLDHHLAGGRVDQADDAAGDRGLARSRSEEHTSELQSRENLVCRLLLEKKNTVAVNE